ncbi:MAG: lipoyl domain-containing protein [Leptospirales bacterium]|jgi:pyruvate/2-oxoglutarate dehydrogenase complex dihydrolipoamide acyltransferase (E2) component
MSESTESSAIPLKVPDIGDAEKIELVAWYVAPGDTVTENQELCELVTDKAAFPLEAPQGGRLGEFLRPAGSQVSVGETLVTLIPTDV